jgi:hypothetical protein
MRTFEIDRIWYGVDGVVIYQKKGEREYICKSCNEKFLYLYDAVRHICK